MGKTRYISDNNILSTKVLFYKDSYLLCPSGSGRLFRIAESFVIFDISYRPRPEMGNLMITNTYSDISLGLRQSEILPRLIW